MSARRPAARFDGTRNRIGTGFVGTLSMMELMPRIDPERAYRLTQPDYPG
ncbi:MAG: hypothetical protein ACLR76_11640 [Alistipes sp.]